jgi:threonine/homoserine/homoserine lactone efflux protein
MADLWAILIPILIADVLNPVLFAFMVYAASTDRPVVKSSAVLMGHTAAYFSAGIVLALGLEKISKRLAEPVPVDFVIELIIGLILLWVAFLSRRDGSKSKSPEERSPKLTPVKAFFFGAIINFIGIPFAVPYFAAIDQILKTDLSATGATMVLVAYNLLYALPFVVVPILSAVMGERGRSLLERIRDRLDRASSFIMPILLALIGVALLADAVTYFVTGEALF